VEASQVVRHMEDYGLGGAPDYAAGCFWTLDWNWKNWRVGGSEVEQGGRGRAVETMKKAASDGADSHR